MFIASPAFSFIFHIMQQSWGGYHMSIVGLVGIFAVIMIIAIAFVLFSDRD